ncbi:MAG TPA: D-alanyl-D-alanine carboxypeptidase/D-alanyl-D-alanine-endopeptidase [Candidatus Cybelea sp.]|jgi:D-alanyl-D-alanine carboxypeptidase/D-alanyl-D-alanine-endopeptidase (penicillin-binding protein 4)|nr:D-alanyl-D-alanine carboxypeptidase/D-alanyl-D-alanine-endopeptidase [Candidatus Cybelea sp.]
MSYVKTSVGYRRRSKRSRVRKRRLFAFLTLVTVATLAIWLWNDGHSRGSGRSIAATPPPAPKTIARASFSPPWTNRERFALDAALRGAFASALNGAHQWSLAVLGSDGRLIYDDSSARAVAPASVQKLIVAASALDALGPRYRFHTIFAAGATPADGTLDSDLWLVGSGDPSLQSSDLRNGIGELSRSGVRRIDGAVVVDATAQSGPGRNPHWGLDDDGQDYAPPTSAISLDGDTIESHETIGGAAQAVWTPMTDVTRYVAAQTKALLAARGIVSADPPAIGSAPLSSIVLWDHRSAPLNTLEAHMLYVSDNHYAEQLLRTVGGAGGQPDDSGGVWAERQFLQRAGIPAPGLRLYDGSGLSPSNRVAAITISRLLISQERSLYHLLPLGGREGTLADYDFTTALGRVRAKSGHLSDVSSLAGYANTTHHGRVAFAFLIDGSPADPDASIVRAIDRLVEF